MSAEREGRAAEPSELESGDTEQTWGQGEGRHEPTIPEPEDQDATKGEDEDEPTSSYADGTPHAMGDRDLPLAREDEGMDR